MAPKVKAFKNAKARADCICRVRASKLIECENSRGPKDRVRASFYTRKVGGKRKIENCFTLLLREEPNESAE